MQTPTRLLIAGSAVLFIVSLLNGFAIHSMRIERLGLSAHLLGLMASTLLLALGGIWDRLNLSRRLAMIGAALALYGFIGGWAVYFFAAASGAGAMFPLLSGGVTGSAAVEAVVTVGMLTMAIALFGLGGVVLRGALHRPSPRE